MKEIFKQYKLPTSYLEFLDKYKNGLSQILYNSEDNINFDEALFYDLWSKETLFEDTFSDGPNYQIPLNIINEIIPKVESFIKLRIFVTSPLNKPDKYS